MKWLSDLIKQKSLIFVGAELTLLYFLIFGFICFHYVDYSKKLSLNELGDLLAGAFAPLAFMWMVITILMQGKELRLQREELSMQREELANSSAQLERQSNVMESQQTQEQREVRLNEIEGMLKDFTEMLVSAGILEAKYKSNMFNGRVTAPGFFEHRLTRVHVFNYIVTQFANAKASDLNYEKKRNEQGTYRTNLLMKLNDIVLFGENINRVAKEYELVELIGRTGFYVFFKKLKSQIEELE